MKPKSITSLLMTTLAVMPPDLFAFQPEWRPTLRVQRSREESARQLEAERAAKHAKLQEVKRLRREAKTR